VQESFFKTQKLRRSSQRKRSAKIVGFILEKGLDFGSLLWYVVVLTGGATYEPSKITKFI